MSLVSHVNKECSLRNAWQYIQVYFLSLTGFIATPISTLMVKQIVNSVKLLMVTRYRKAIFLRISIKALLPIQTSILVQKQCLSTLITNRYH